MDDSRTIAKNPPATLKEMQAQRVLRKDPRFRAANDLAKASEEISAPAFTQERSFGKIIGSTLSLMAKGEALRQKGETLPQNELKDRFDTASSALPEDYGKGGVIDGNT